MKSVLCDRGVLCGVCIYGCLFLRRSYDIVFRLFLIIVNSMLNGFFFIDVVVVHC